MLKWYTNTTQKYDCLNINVFTDLPRKELALVLLRLLLRCTALLLCGLAGGVLPCSSPSEWASIFNSATLRCNSDVSPPSCCLVNRSNSASRISRCAYKQPLYSSYYTLWVWQSIFITTSTQLMWKHAQSYTVEINNMHTNVSSISNKNNLN